MKTKKLSLHRLKKVVIKIGSNVLCDSKGPRSKVFREIVRLTKSLHEKNIQVVLVSSGAIAMGRAALAFSKKAVSIPEKQALAAVGQTLLMQEYSKHFARVDLKTAQILLTHPDFENRHRYLNARHALAEIIDFGVVPIVNENDTVSVDEIKFGDNDRLSSLVAHLLSAHALIILSHVDGLLDEDPSQNSQAKLIPFVEYEEKNAEQFVFKNKNELGTGGMASKISAANTAREFGIPVFLTNGLASDLYARIFGDEPVGTFFAATENPLRIRAQWIAKVVKPLGTLVVDEGAAKALMSGKKSLLSSGILQVKGFFENGDCVEVRDAQNKLVAKGFTAYSAVEAEKIAGKKSSEIAPLLGYGYGAAVIHRDDLIVC